MLLNKSKHMSKVLKSKTVRSSDISFLHLKEMSKMPHIVETTYLSVDYSCHPEAFSRPWHRQHGPEEDENWQDEREERR